MQADEAGAILSRSRQVLRRQAEDAGCEDGLSPDSVPPADPPKERKQADPPKERKQANEAFAILCYMLGRICGLLSLPLLE